MSEMEKYIKAIAPAIDHIAFTRRMGELSDLDMAGKGEELFEDLMNSMKD